MGLPQVRVTVGQDLEETITPKREQATNVNRTSTTRLTLDGEPEDEIAYSESPDPFALLASHESRQAEGRSRLKYPNPLLGLPTVLQGDILVETPSGSIQLREPRISGRCALSGLTANCLFHRAGRLV